MSETILIDGEDRVLGLQMPDPGQVNEFPVLGPNVGDFKPLSKNEIIERIRKKPLKRRDLFGPEWMQNQRSHGSCNAAAAAYVQRKGQFLRGRMDTPMLNWEFLYAQINRGRDAGSLLVDGMRACAEIGTPVLSSTHRIGTGRIYKHQFTPEEYADARNNRVTGIYVVRDELTLATLVLDQPAVVAVHVGNGFMNFDRRGIAGTDRGPGNHAVHVDDVEIIDGELVFDHQGSWGVNVHDKGRAYLTWDRHFAQTVRNHDFWVLLSTNDGDDPLQK